MNFREFQYVIWGHGLAHVAGLSYHKRDQTIGTEKHIYQKWNVQWLLLLCTKYTVYLSWLWGYDWTFSLLVLNIKGLHLYARRYFSGDVWDFPKASQLRIYVTQVNTRWLVIKIPPIFAESDFYRNWKKVIKLLGNRLEI